MRALRPLLGPTQRTVLGLETMRGISNTSGSSHAEPKLAVAEQGGQSIDISVPPAAGLLPRWERELGVIRTDWT